MEFLKKDLNTLIADLANLIGEQLAEKNKLVKDFKKRFNAQADADRKKRTINQGLLVHRLVADFFCNKPSEQHESVIHKDFNKLNNHWENLQWATMEENIAHQQYSPHVIAEKENRKNIAKRTAGNYKLTVTRVMLIKKRLLEGRTMRQLSRQFKVTETQIARIKKGENWAHVPAAE